jgi:hypothetical protein
MVKTLFTLFRLSSNVGPLLIEVQTIKKGLPNGKPFLELGVWRCATLTWGNPTLPSPLTCFTSEFGMESGGTTSLLSPDITGFNKLGILILSALTE